MRKIISIFAFIAEFFCAYAQTPAFPGAEGGGMYTTGGRGGKVLYVTSLADDGSKGTLRWAVYQKGPRTVLFNVSGIISLTKPLSIKNDSLTIAGQSAPGDGICIKDYDVFVGANNVIIRFMRFRLGDLVKEHEPDAYGGRDHKNVIIDHCSSSWSVDECASFYSNENFTMQWCIISEALNNSEHPKGAHGYGGIWGGKNATFHHNLIADNNSRNPRFNGFKRAGLKYNNSQDEERVDFRNNVIYNWGDHSSYGGESGTFNIVANYFKAGQGTNPKIKDRITQVDMDADPAQCPPGYGKYFIDGNFVFGFPEVTKDNWKGVSIDKGIDPLACKALKPYECTAVKTQSAEVAYEKVLTFAGASYRRDAIDTRVTSEVKTGVNTYKGKLTGRAGLIDSQSDVGGWPEYKSEEAPVDANKDGIPDSWLEKNYPGKTATDVNKEGYTYLEVYLNSLVQPIIDNQTKDSGCCILKKK
ncbi:MAG TPA: pectate lyase [Paludibacter sp.]|nr:pectate lyase [Paludibacter sp.]